MSAGQARAGGVMSRTVTVKLQVLVFRLESLAEQFTIVFPRAKAVPEAGVQVTLTLPSQASVAVVVKVTVAFPAPVHSAVMLAGQVMLGAVVSRTMTLKLHEPVLPLESVAEQLTVLVPNGKAKPEAGVQVALRTPSQVSVARVLKVTVAFPEPVHSAVMLVEQVRTGKVVSTTVTVKLHAPVLPPESVAEQLTVVGPSGKELPDAGTQVTGRLPSQLSNAVALKETLALPEPVH